jgi:hypothetical protein
LLSLRWSDSGRCRKLDRRGVRAGEKRTGRRKASSRQPCRASASTGAELSRADGAISRDAACGIDVACDTARRNGDSAAGSPGGAAHDNGAATTAARTAHFASACSAADTPGGNTSGFVRDPHGTASDVSAPAGDDVDAHRFVESDRPGNSTAPARDVPASDGSRDSADAADRAAGSDDATDCTTARSAAENALGNGSAADVATAATTTTASTSAHVGCRA